MDDVAQDPRWLSAVQYIAHLLHHPNLKELYLMEGSLNAMGLLDDLTAGAGETVEETHQK